MGWFNHQLVRECQPKSLRHRGARGAGLLYQRFRLKPTPGEVWVTSSVEGFVGGKYWDFGWCGNFQATALFFFKKDCLSKKVT